MSRSGVWIYEFIVSVLSEYPEGVGISRLHEVLAARFVEINRRTLQRRLAHLEQEGRLIAEGKSVARVYKPLIPVTYEIPGAAPRRVAMPDGVYEVYAPVSEEGAEILALIRKPLAHRLPVGYDRSFLEGYEPGVSQYLSDPIRLQLHEIGCSPAQGQPAGTYARDILGRLRVDLPWASSRLEGNTYSQSEVRALIESGKAAGGRHALETQMILNHEAAVEMLVENIDEIGFDVFTFRNLHDVLSQNLWRNDAASGHLRRRPVEISGTVFHPSAMPEFIESRFNLFLEKAAAIPDPFEQAFFIMVQLPYLQPFEDANKPVSRLGANIPLLKHNLCPLSFIDVSALAYTEGALGVYELRRVELLRDVFMWAYERSCQRYLAVSQTPAEPDPLRLRYQQELIEAVQTLVRGKMAPTGSNIRKLSGAVPRRDRKAFECLLEEALRHLDENRLARYRLKRSEYVEWKFSLEGR